MNDINVSSSISDKSSTFKKHALRHINKVSNESTSFLIHQEILRSQRVTKRKSYHLSSQDSSFENEKSTVFSLVSKRWLSDVIQTSIKIDIRRDKISLLTSSSSFQKSKLSHHFHNFSQIFKLMFRVFCNKSQDINLSTCICADSFINSIISSFISSKSSTFKKHAFRHINKVSNETTSFIFITLKLLDAFHHVFKMFTNSSIVIIDLKLMRRLRNTQKKNFYSVIHSIKSLKLKSLNNYRDASDWLMWDEISESSILNCNTIADLMMSLLFTSENLFYFEAICSAAYSSITRAHIRKTCTSLISHNNQAVDRLLCILNISTSHLHDVIYAVITDWKFNAFRSERWKQNNEFMKDVHKRFRKETSSVSENIEIKREDQKFHSQKEVINMMLEIQRADSQALKNTVSEKNAIYKVNDDKQSSINLNNEMKRRMLNDDWWVQAFREQLKRYLTCKASTKILLRKMHFSVLLTE